MENESGLNIQITTRVDGSGKKDKKKTINTRR